MVCQLLKYHGPEKFPPASSPSLCSSAKWRGGASISALQWSVRDRVMVNALIWIKYGISVLMLPKPRVRN